MKKTGIEKALSMITAFYQQLVSSVCGEQDCDECPFAGHICLDADTVITELEEALKR